MKLGWAAIRPVDQRTRTAPEVASVCIKTSHDATQTKQPKLRLQSGFPFSFTVFAHLVATVYSVSH